MPSNRYAQIAPKVRALCARYDLLPARCVDPAHGAAGGVIGFVRGLSVRDVEAALVDALGEQATVSRSTVSRICEQLKTEFEAWSRRRAGRCS